MSFFFVSIISGFIKGLNFGHVLNRVVIDKKITSI